MFCSHSRKIENQNRELCCYFCRFECTVTNGGGPGPLSHRIWALALRRQLGHLLAPPPLWHLCWPQRKNLHQKSFASWRWTGKMHFELVLHVSLSHRRCKGFFLIPRRALMNVNLLIHVGAWYNNNKAGCCRTKDHVRLKQERSRACWFGWFIWREDLEETSCWALHKKFHPSIFFHLSDSGSPGGKVHPGQVPSLSDG